MLTDLELYLMQTVILCRDWVNNKNLLSIIGNYIQCPVINHNGKEYEKECVYMYDNHFAVSVQFSSGT